jgi:non-ribosomal peptide synthetase component E (peptide arylation enzyme)
MSAIALTACDRIENALAAIVTAGEQCALAHDRVTELLLQHPDVKARAIAAMIGTPDPLKGENGKHSAASAEKVVEQNADYLAFRQLQRAAEVERWGALARVQAAEVCAKVEILKYDRAEGEA